MQKKVTLDFKHSNYQTKTGVCLIQYQIAPYISGKRTKETENIFILSDLVKMCTFTTVLLKCSRFGKVLPLIDQRKNHWQTLSSIFFSENMDLHVFSARNTVRGTATAYQQNDRFYFEAGWSICLQRWRIARKACSCSRSFILDDLEDE